MGHHDAGVGHLVHRQQPVGLAHRRVVFHQPRRRPMRDAHPVPDADDHVPRPPSPLVDSHHLEVARRGRPPSRRSASPESSECARPASRIRRPGAWPPSNSSPPPPVPDRNVTDPGRVIPFTANSAPVIVCPGVGLDGRLQVEPLTRQEPGNDRPLRTARREQLARRSEPAHRRIGQDADARQTGPEDEDRTHYRFHGLLGFKPRVGPEGGGGRRPGTRRRTRQNGRTGRWEQRRGRHRGGHPRSLGGGRDRHRTPGSATIRLGRENRGKGRGYAQADVGDAPVRLLARTQLEGLLPRVRGPRTRGTTGRALFGKKT
jgi:hypothetical protein